MEQKNIRADLRNSLDMTVLRQDLILVAAVDAIVLVIFGFTTGGILNKDFLLAAVFVCGITVIPVLCYSLWITAQIFRRADSYTLYRCKLSQPYHCKWSRGAMYFTVLLEGSDGKFVVNTRPIFASYGMAGPLLEDYINKTATIAYNEETEMVVVIG